MLARPHPHPTAPGPGLGRSAVYRGTVTHRRSGEIAHSFSTPVAMVSVDLGAVAALCALHPLWSEHRWTPIQLRRSDYLGDPTVPLDRAVRDLVEQRTGGRPDGPITLLTNVRTWGWLFNPISCYYCYDADGAGVRWMVAEVTNTPWHERHCYVVGAPGEHRLAKALHVSPFFGMDQTYRLRYTEPGEHLSVWFDVEEQGQRRLVAGMDLRRLPATRRSLAGVTWSPRRTTMGVSAGIYRQAFALWRKGAGFHPNPHAVPPVADESGSAVGPSPRR